MSLKNILSISGKPGLFKILSGNRTPVVVQDLSSGVKRTLFPRDQVISLGDISMYTTQGDKQLGEVLDAVYEKYEGKALDAKGITASNDSLRAFFTDVLPEHDADKVYPADIKKVVQWYNLLLKDGFTSFAEKEDESTNKETEEKTKTEEE